MRERRELTRYREKLVVLRTSCKDQVHAVLGKLGIPVTCSDIFGSAGPAWLDGLGLPPPYGGKVTSLRQLIGEVNAEITMLPEVLADLLAADRGYRVIQQLPGIGPGHAAQSKPRFRSGEPANSSSSRPAWLSVASAV